MRVSTYEIILPLIFECERESSDKALLFNGLYGALDVVGKQTAEKILKKDITRLSVTEREYLTFRGHITCKDEIDELGDAQLLGRTYRKIVARNSISLVILPTYDCNFRCPYCFERHRLIRGQDWLSHEMKPEVINAIFSALKVYKARGYSINNCTLYGGEPLLSENMLTVRDICEHAWEMNMSIGAVTNGYDLENYLDILSEFKFQSLQVTIDGVREINDRRRCHRDRLPTYERILRNIALALKRNVDVSLRVNVNRENLDNFSELIADLAVHGLKETPQAEIRRNFVEKNCGYFSYYFKAVSEATGSPTYVTEREVLDAIIATGISPLDAIYKQSQYSGIAKIIHRIINKKKIFSFSPTYCGAERGMLVIDPYGKIFPCWDFVSRYEDAIGFTDSVSGKFFFGFNRAKWRTRTSDIMKPCCFCPYIFICRGGCASAAERKYKDYFRENCGEIKEIFSYVTPRIVGREFEKSKKTEMSISLAPFLSRLTEVERSILMNSNNRKELLEILKSTGLLEIQNSPYI